MSIEDAIDILHYHNQWRRGHKKHARYSPAEIGMAIDIILAHVTLSSIESQDFIFYLN